MHTIKAVQYWILTQVRSMSDLLNKKNLEIQFYVKCDITHFYE